MKLHKEASIGLQNLQAYEIQAVVNQVTLAVAERFGIGVGHRNNLAPRTPFTPENTKDRLHRAQGIANALHHVYGHSHFERHVVFYLYGVPVRTLRQPETPEGLSTQQQSLIWALERLAKLKEIEPNYTRQIHLQHKELLINNVEAAEIAVSRVELKTHNTDGWRHLHFQDPESFQRLEIAVAMTPLLDPKSALEYAMQLIGRIGTRPGARS